MNNSNAPEASSTKRTRNPRGKEHAKSIDTVSVGRRSSLQGNDVKVIIKEKLQEEVEISEESTKVCAKRLCNTLASCQDECETVVNPLRKKQPLLNPQPMANGKTVQRAKPDPEKIAAIMNSPPLRDRFSHLLPSHMLLPIGYQLTKLLEKVSCLERTISFLKLSRRQKVNFFADLTKNIQQCLKITITQDDFRRMLFLAPSFYNVVWEKNDRIKRYDLVIRTPSSEESEDTRKMNFRRAIVDYLSRLHEEFLAKVEVTGAIPAHKWHAGFNLDQIEVPLGRLPDHPLHKNISIQDMTEKEVAAIENKKVREVIQSEREQSVKSDTKSAAAAFLEQRKETGSFTNRLYEIVREKERKLKEAQLKKEADKQAGQDNELIIKVMEEVLEIYISKAVSNMFLVSVLDMLERRMSTFPTLQLQHTIEEILKCPIPVMTEVAHLKGKILRMDKSKYNEARQHYLSKIGK